MIGGNLNMIVSVKRNKVIKEALKKVYLFMKVFISSLRKLIRIINKIIL